MRRSYDPTFALLILLWHALYSWDEALEQLYEHICSMVRLAEVALVRAA